MGKKTFKEALTNPAMQFISTPIAEAKQETVTLANAPEGYKANPIYIETKSKRLQLLIQPSLYEKIKVIAKKKGESVNNTIHSILEDATKGE